MLNLFNFMQSQVSVQGRLSAEKAASGFHGYLTILQGKEETHTNI